MDKEKSENAIFENEQNYVKMTKAEYDKLWLVIRTQAETIERLTRMCCEQPKNCKPYTGPKVVQMFPKSKSE